MPVSNALLYTVTVLIWGSTWFAIEFQLGIVEPEVSIVYRYAAAAAILFGWARVRGLPLRYGLREHAWFMLLGLLLFGLNYVFAYRAQVYITSALTAIAFSSIVWMNIINARLFLGVRAGARVLVGTLLGIAGIVTLFAPEVGAASLTDSVFIGVLLAVAGAFVASLGNMVSQAAQTRKLPIVQSNAWGMLYGTAFSAVIAAVRGLPLEFDMSPAYLVSLAYLSIFGSIIAFGASLQLLGRIGAHRAGYAMVMFPVVALALSSVFEGLAITANIIAGTILALTGNLFVIGGRARPARTQPPREDGAESPARVTPAPHPVVGYRNMCPELVVRSPSASQGQHAAG